MSLIAPHRKLVRPDSLVCDACGATYAKETPGIVIGYFGLGEFGDFCSRLCMLTCFASGGKLRDGRIVLALFGRTPAEHLTGRQATG